LKSSEKNFITFFKSNNFFTTCNDTNHYLHYNDKTYTISHPLSIFEGHTAPYVMGYNNKIFTVHDNKLITKELDVSQIVCVNFVANMLVLGCIDNTVHLYDVTTNKTIFSTEMEYIDQILCISATHYSNNIHIYCGTLDGYIYIINLTYNLHSCELESVQRKKISASSISSISANKHNIFLTTDSKFLICTIDKIIQTFSSKNFIDLSTLNIYSKEGSNLVLLSGTKDEVTAFEVTYN
jgi:WD40 repeat protein